MIKLNYKVLEHELEFTFRISRGSKDTCKTVLIELDYQDIKAYGEAVFSEFYGETQDSVINFYTQVTANKILDDLDPFNLQEFEARINNLENSLNHKSNQAAKSGLDIALWDLRAKILKLPLYKLLCLDKNRCPKTSYTIGLADLDTIKRKTLIALERGYDVLKVKLGSNDDIKIVELIRELAPQSLIRVDANAAWQVNDALKVLNHIQQLNIEFVEEPLKLDSSTTDYEKLYNESPLELMADESCHTLKDIPYCAKYFHSINIKHTKSGGISETIRMIHTARAHNLKIMLGCFSETTISIGAFAHISPLVDFNDLDGSLLLKNEPYKAIGFAGSNILLKDSPGLGY